MVDFVSIPSGIRTNSILAEFDPTQARSGTALKPFRVLLIGGRTDEGATAELVLSRVTGADDAGGQFGAGSTLHNLAQFYFRNGGQFLETYAVAVDDTGTAAVRTITVTGAQTQAGTIFLYVCGRRLPITVAASTASDTLTVIAARIAAAINAKVELPFTATSALGVVTITAKNAGTCGSDADLRLNYNPGEITCPGLAVAFAQTTPGANNADVSGVWAVLGEDQYDVVISAFDDSADFDELDGELEDRWGPIRANDGLAFVAKRATLSAATTFANGKNSKHVCLLPMQAPLESPHEIAGAFGGVAARYGSQDPSRPFQTLELIGIHAPATADRFDWYERNQLLYDGCSTYKVAPGGKVVIDRIITTYQKNALNAADDAFLKAETRLTLSFLRYDFVNKWALRFPRAKLSSDDTFTPAPGQQWVTPSVATAEAVAIFQGWQELGLVEDLDAFKEQLVVEITGDQLNFVLPPDLIGQLIVTAARIAFRL